MALHVLCANLLRWLMRGLPQVISRLRLACFRSNVKARSVVFAGEGVPCAPIAASTMSCSGLASVYGGGSVTLYGFDPATRPDIYGKVGNSGVSIATLDDMRALYDSFDLCDPRTSCR